MEVLFLGSFFPAELHGDIARDSIGPVANANNALQFALLAGLSYYYNDIYAITLPNVGAFPKRYRSVFFPGTDLCGSFNITGASLGFFNLLGVKHLSRYAVVKRALHQRLSSIHGRALIFIYDLHPPFLAAINELKHSFPMLTVCAIVPDLPGFTNGSNSIFHKSFRYLEKNYIEKSFECIDGFVLLSKYMVEKLPVHAKPWVVVEGVFNAEEGSASEERVATVDKTIFYAGSLDRRNGVLRLVEAFQKISQADYRLVICGAGDTASEIQDIAASDPRIDFKGQIPRTDVLALQKMATLLVNPRTPEGEFTRYSFPSKTMEYLASSTPMLMYRLEGVPEEYFEHCYVLDDLSLDRLAQEIVTICESDPQVLQIRTAAAKRFILDQKNPLSQCGKIYRLANQLISERLPVP